MFDIKIYQYINKKLFIYFLISKTFIKNLNQIVWQYNLLVSEILNFRKNVLKNNSFNEYIRITQKNLPHLILKLQC